MSNENQNPFGISREEILNLAAQKIADEHSDSDGDFLSKRITKIIEDRINKVFSESLTLRINSFMDAEIERLVEQKIIPVDMWGDSTGKPTTIRESLSGKALRYWNEKVDNEGRLSDSYSAKPRHEWMFRKITGEEFDKVVKQNIVNLVCAFKDAIREDEKNKIDSYLNDLLKVKSNGDKK